MGRVVAFRRQTNRATTSPPSRGRITVGSSADDVAALQNVVAAQQAQLSAVIAECGSKVSDADRTAWYALARRCVVWAGAQPALILNAAQRDEGLALAAQLETWRAKLVAAGCASTPAPLQLPAPTAPGALDNLMSGIGTGSGALLLVALVVLASRKR